jgi:hypothetical protein
LAHDINSIRNEQFPDERHNAFRPIKSAREFLDLLKAHFKDNEIYSKILHVVYRDKIDCEFARHQTYDPEKQKIIFIAQRNLEYLKENDRKIKELPQKIDPITQNTPALLLGPINQLLGMCTVIKDTVKSFDMFFKFPDRWDN